MAFNVNEFRYANLIPFYKPFASPAYFEAYFTKIPVILSREVVGVFGTSFIGNILNNAAQEIIDRVTAPSPATNVRFRVQSADLPQRQLEVQPRFTNGPQRMIPFGTIYATTHIEVIESDQYDMRNFFDTWMDAITSMSHRKRKVGNDNKYRMHFYDDIVSEFVIVAFSSNGLPQFRWTLKEAYPVAVNASQMNWGAVDQYVTIPVEIAYHEWEFKELNLIDILSDPAYAALIARGAVSGVLSTIL